MELLVEEGAKALFAQGLLGVLLVISGIVTVLLYRESKACANARLEDTKALIKAVQDSASAIASMTLALEGTNRAMEARTRAAEVLAAEMRELRIDAAHNDDKTHETLERLCRLLEGRQT